MSDEEAALLEVIHRHRAEDAPRLVYADWLGENGRPDRATLVRVQCEVARVEATLAYGFANQWLCESACASWCPTCGDCCCPEPEVRRDDPRCPLHAPESRHHSDASLGHVLAGLKDRELHLLADRDVCLELGLTQRYVKPRAWNAHLRGGDAASGGATAWGCAVRRGFVERVQMPAADWLAHHGTLFWHPDQTLTCPGCRGARGFAEKAGLASGGERGVDCPTCKGDGSVPRPFVRTAHPLTAVTISDVGMYAFCAAAASPGFTIHGQNTGPVFEPNTATISRWPGVTFHFPPEG